LVGSQRGQSARGGVDCSGSDEEAYMTEDMPARRVEDYVNRLVETQQDKERAQRALDHFKDTVRPPQPPDEFANMRIFLEWHVSRRRYEEQLANHEDRLSKLENTYQFLTEKLLTVLPLNVPLHYEYPGARPGLGNTVYTIMNREGQLSVERKG
jgi:hypothetical protein